MIDLRRLVTSDQARGPRRILLGAAAAPLAVVYEGAVRLWRAAPARQATVGRPVVSVGSVLVGGTGKTPIAMLVAGTLSAAGHRVCILSRGYRRKGTRSPLVASDGNTLAASVEEAGDEPYLLARRLPGVSVVVGADRASSARLALAEFDPGVFVLDDGFQVRHLRKDLEIVVVDRDAATSRQALLPLGRLREPWSAIRPGHLVVVTDNSADRAATPDAAERLCRLATRDVFRAHREFPAVIDGEDKRIEPGAAGRERCLVLCGIASPAGFGETCRRAGLDVRVSIWVDDHHWYSQDEVALVERKMSEYGCTRLVTTEKDIAKLPASIQSAAWTIRADVTLDRPESFWTLFRERLGWESLRA